MAFIGNTVQTQGFTPAVDYFSGNGSTVTFTLSRNIASVAQVICAIDNVIQNPSSAYTVSGNAITFTSAPLSGTNNIWVEYTSLITTYNGISQSPSVIGDLTASGGYLSTGSFNNSFVDGTIVDYVTGNGRVTVGTADGFTIYNGGTTARSSLLALNASGAMGVGTSPSYGTAGQVLTSQGSSAAPVWQTPTYTIDYLVVGGGGGGGSEMAGGGGAGGYISTTAYTVTSSAAFVVTIGAGGAGTVNTYGANGGNSSFGSLTTSLGGGGGGYETVGGISGGSGGGGGTKTAGAASGTSGQGNSGGNGTSYGSYAGGGGGGAGAAGGNGSGSTAGNGGVGLNWQSLGTYYAGGGGGGAYSGTSGTRGTGGNGGGGSGGIYSGSTPSTPATDASINTGGGGGAGPNSASGAVNCYGGSGGSGIVIVRYAGSTQRGTGGTVTITGGYVYHTFTSSSTYTA